MRIQENSNSRKYLIVVGILLCCLKLGPYSSFAAITPEQVVFTHPEEMVTKPGFIILADRRIFAVMSFVNACGYDEETNGQQMHPVRRRVRELISKNLAGQSDKLQSWRKYYKAKNLHISGYKHFALTLNDDYPFRRMRPESELMYPKAATQLRDFIGVLNAFWKTARLEEIWQEVKGDYLAEIKKYNLEKMPGQVASMWEYLRLPRQDSFVFVNVPNLLDARYNASGAHYENYYYSVESAGSIRYGLHTHEYLHSVVNSLVGTNMGRYQTKLLAYIEASKGKEYSKSYGSVLGLTCECLVRAVDYRMWVLASTDTAAGKRKEEALSGLTKSGLTLAMPFYRLLAEYEQSGKNFREFMPVLLEKLPAYKK